MKSIFSKASVLFVVLLLLNVVAKADIIRLIIKEERANCTGVGPQTCYQVKYKYSKDWELFYSAITGFNYEPGYQYTIDVIRTKRKQVPADASQYTYRLKKIIEKKLVAQTIKYQDFITRYKWNLIQINGKTQSSPKAYLIFEKGNTRVSGFSGCNRIFGSFEITANTITFKNLASTMMACENNELESAFMAIINNKSLKYDIADQTLNFYSGNKLVLMFGLAPLDKK